MCGGGVRGGGVGSVASMVYRWHAGTLGARVSDGASHTTRRVAYVGGVCGGWERVAGGGPRARTSASTRPELARRTRGTRG